MNKYFLKVNNIHPQYNRHSQPIQYGQPFISGHMNYANNIFQPGTYIYAPQPMQIPIQQSYGFPPQYYPIQPQSPKNQSTSSG